MAKSLSKGVPTCSRGHKLTAANTRHTGGHKGKYMKCRLCANESAKQWARKRAARLKRLERMVKKGLIA
jgi:hypothetical protein